MQAGRSAGIVLTALAIMSAASGGARPWVLVALGAIGLGWQAWLFVPCVLVTGTSVVCRGFVSRLEIPIDQVDGFEITIVRTPLDHFSRSVDLVIRRCDGSVVLCPWVGWNDRITPLLPVGTRPTTPSQHRVMDRLNAALEQARRAAPPSSGAASPRN